jgi:hypothetical protein
MPDGPAASTIVCEDVPLNEGRRMSRGPRLIPTLSNTPKERIRLLHDTATRMPLLESTSPTHNKKLYRPRGRRGRCSGHRQNNP